MDIEVYDSSLNSIGLVDDYKSLVWQPRYNDIGSFTLYTLFNIKKFRLLQPENILYIQEQEYNTGVIETIGFSTTQEGELLLTVYGRLLLSYTDRRIVKAKIDFNGTAENFMYRAVRENCTIGNRAIPLLTLSEPKGYTEALIKSVQYKYVNDVLKDAGSTSELGCRINMLPKDKLLQFEVFKGTDRSIHQSLVKRVIFSKSMENILSENYMNSLKDYKNYALIAGAGEDSDRKISEIGNEYSGLNRRELFVDARDIQNTKTVNDAEVTIPDAEYMPLLNQKGHESLLEHKKSESFTSTVNPCGNNKYGINFFIGDIVTVEDDLLNICIDTMITGIDIVYEENGRKVNPIFGDAVPTILDKLKQLERK